MRYRFKRFSDTQVFGNPDIEAAYRAWNERYVGAGEADAADDDVGRWVITTLERAKLLSDAVHFDRQHRFYNQETVAPVEFLFRALVEFNTIIDAAPLAANERGRSSDVNMGLLVAFLRRPHAQQHRHDPRSYAQWVYDTTVTIVDHAAEGFDALYESHNHHEEPSPFDHPFARLVLSVAVQQPGFLEQFVDALRCATDVPYELIPVGIDTEYALITTEENPQ